MNYIWTHWSVPEPHKWQLNWQPVNMAMLGLSVALAKTHGTARAVYTDTAGARTIEDYAVGVNTEVILDPIQNEDPRKWALGKIHTYRHIDFPCVHIDNDLFLAKPQSASNAAICVETIERGNYDFYYKNTTEAYLQDAELPEVMVPFVEANDWKAYCVGYFQINDVPFVHEYAEEAMEIFSKMKTFRQFNNIFPEQRLLYCMATAQNKTVDILFDGGLDEKGNSWDEQVRDAAHAEKGYTHLMGKKWSRKIKYVMQRIMEKLQELNPTCHDRVQEKLDWEMISKLADSLGRTPAKLRPKQKVIHPRVLQCVAATMKSYSNQYECILGF